MAPTRPGVYLFKDAQNNVLYVGKAANLRSRLRSYFAAPHTLPSKLQNLVAKIEDVEVIATDSEQEALILELNLIKKYRPRYNVRLKDDKTFPYLKITLEEDYPRIYVTRHFIKDGSRYFGPFASASSVRQTLRLIKKIFPFRSCNRTITTKESRPCLDFHIKRCLGPCVGAVSKKDYAEVIKQVVLFLEGKEELVLAELKHRMKTAAEQLQFEKAALLRDQIKAVENVIEGQKIAATVSGTQDAIALAQDRDQACVQIFFIRNGKLIGRDSFIMEGIHQEKPEQIMTSFVKQYYVSAQSIPPLILLQYPIEDQATISQWLKTLRKGIVRLVAPQKGNKKQLVDMVARNVEQQLELLKLRHPTLPEIANSLEELRQRLDLPKTPQRIEGYDISNIGGALAVGSMVVFERGLPKPSHYRRFKIKTVAKADDYAMIQEVLRRRFHRHATGEGSWAVTPDLILIDGGKGHLNAALEVMQELKIDRIAVASLAKEQEEVLIPGASEPLDIPANSPALHLLQRVRDEAHRFALGYHQRQRQKTGLTSVLDSIPGIGAKRKRALLKKFGSVEGIKYASIEELTSVKGITSKLAEKVKEYLVLIHLR